MAFSSVSQCQLQGDIKFSQITGDGDKVVNLLSIKGQLILRMKSGKLFIMET